MVTTIQIQVESGEVACSAKAFADGRLVATASDVNEAAAVRACMKEAKVVVPGEVRFQLPYCGKNFQVAWFEKRAPLSAREAASVRRREHIDPSLSEVDAKEAGLVGGDSVGRARPADNLAAAALFDHLAESDGRR